MNESAMQAEFDTVADWTLEAVTELGPDHAIPAGYRGSGGPPALDWLVQAMALQGGETLLDAGAGVGGPAAYAAAQVATAPTLAEPMLGACRAARALFGLPVIIADAQRLPVRSAAFDAAWSLGVLCTIADKRAAMRELRRILRPGGALGLIVYVQRQPALPDAPDGNSFPTDRGLSDLLDDAGFTVHSEAELSELGAPPQDWHRRGAEVDRFIAGRHGHDQRWQLAQRQSEQMGDLLAEGRIAGRLIAATAR